MKDLYEQCICEIEIALEDLKNHHIGKNANCSIKIDKRLETDAVCAVIVKIHANIEQEKMKKCWDRIQKDIKLRIGRGLSILEFIDVHVNKCQNEYTYLILMFS